MSNNAVPICICLARLVGKLLDSNYHDGNWVWAGFEIMPPGNINPTTVKVEIFAVLYTPYILRGFYFREFCESGASREFNDTRKIYLRSGRMNATCVRNISTPRSRS